MKNSNRKHIVVGLSGGVDSSVTAALLKEEGHTVEGIFMKNWEADDTDDFCPASADMADAEAVCKQLNIPFKVVNFAEKYWEKVFTIFLHDLKLGFTPNPDVLCNSEIKFKAFLDLAINIGADAIATGHYARINDNHELLKGIDPNKDQSYFLHQLSRNQLKLSMFPLGNMTKDTVRQIAKKLALPTHNKRDSTGICFIGKKRFKNFLQEYLPDKCGPIKTITGSIIGQHDGLMYYTIGQRQGLNIGGLTDAKDLPWYVINKDIKTNTLIVGQGQDNPKLFTHTLLTNKIHWINKQANSNKKVFAKIRYRQTDQECTIIQIDNNTHKITFTKPQRAITPGQSIVFYQGDICLGGSVILKTKE